MPDKAKKLVRARMQKTGETYQTAPRDGSPANVAKFNAPVVANGRVFVATFSNALNVYGLR
jgi:hypothetical protein